MSGWLDPVRRVLDEREHPVAIFLRDDDAGWADDRLAPLVDTCDRHGLPLDLAVIPSELSEARVAWLDARRHAYSARLGLHQHGWGHANHETAGRKCEFGASRSEDELRHDLTQGRVRMLQAFGAAVDPVFTPPWNRCVEAVGPMLVALGIDVLSRDVTARALGLDGLRECPVHVDWSARRKGAGLTPDGISASCADALSRRTVVGLLFHHAVMDDGEMAMVSELLALLSRHPMVRGVSLLAAATMDSASGAVASELIVEASA